MPELPEVETIRLGLASKIINLQIKNITILNPKSFLGDPKEVIGKKVMGIWRRAKILGIDLEGKHVLLIHLKMSGQLVFEGEETLFGGHPTLDMKDGMPNKSTRVIFEFSDESKLYFNDQRKFGWIRVVDSKQVAVDSFLKHLGPEPLEKEFSWQVLKKNLLKRKSLFVKTAILDQSIVSGIGNIYASEACFLAGLDPRKKVSELKDEQFRSLHRAVIKSLKNGLKYGGSTIAHFIDPEGKKGYYLDYAYVYYKKGKKCKSCQTQIEKIQLNGRGTYFCPSCQT